MSEVPATRRCARHPERDAAAACQRCGTFVCAEDRRELDGIIHCPDCFARPGHDVVEAFRERHWGKRDLWAWAVGVSVPLQAYSIFVTIRDAHGAGWIALQVALGILYVGYFLRQRWARFAILLTPVVLLLKPPGTDEALARAGGDASMLWATQLFFAAVFAVALWAMFQDVRNRLFFRVEIPRARLERAYVAYADNRIAVWGLVLGAAGFIVPGLSVAGLPMAITALLRARSDVTPRIGRSRMAVVGIVLGVLSLLFWVAVTAALLWVKTLIDSGQLRP